MSLRTALVGILTLAVGWGGLARAQQPAADDAPPVPKGVEVLARGPVHEAFATLATEPEPSKPVPKKPPKPLEEMPPDEKPEGEVLWIPGYWHYDDDRNDWLWVSGIWRKAPQGRRWVAGYWRDEGDGAVWVGGYWADDRGKDTQDVTYLPPPPPPPTLAAPGNPPQPETFYVPGHWVWTGAAYAWQAGYWARVKPGQVWVPAHYRWTPGGYVYVPGYWDLAVADRGVLFAPVYVDAVVAGPGFVYTPAYAVPDTLVVDALFVRPCCCHYYFGDYYGATYRSCGFESCVVYSRRCYDPIITYAVWEHRDEPRWSSVQIDLVFARDSGRAPVPPRTLVQQNVIVQNNVTNITNVNVVKSTTVNQTALMPAKTYAKSKGITTVAVDAAARAQAMKQAETQQKVAQQRREAEVAPPGGKVTQPKVASLAVPKPQPLGKPAGNAGQAVHQALAHDQSPGSHLSPASHTEPGKPPPTPQGAATTAPPSHTPGVTHTTAPLIHPDASRTPLAHPQPPPSGAAPGQPPAGAAPPPKSSLLGMPAQQPARSEPPPKKKPGKPDHDH